MTRGIIIKSCLHARYNGGVDVVLANYVGDNGAHAPIVDASDKEGEAGAHDLEIRCLGHATFILCVCTLIDVVQVRARSDSMVNGGGAVVLVPLYELVVRLSSGRTDRSRCRHGLVLV